MLEALVAYGLPESGRVFTARDGGPMQPGAIGICIRDHLYKCGVTRSAHSLRHAFGTAVYRSSKDMLLTKSLMGHSSLATVLLYVELTPDESATSVVFGL